MIAGEGRVRHKLERGRILSSSSSSCFPECRLFSFTNSLTFTSLNPVYMHATNKWTAWKTCEVTGGKNKKNEYGMWIDMSLK